MTSIAAAVSNIPEGYLSDVTALVNIVRSDEETVAEVRTLLEAGRTVVAQHRTPLASVALDLDSSDAREVLACQQLIGLALDVAQVVVSATLRERDPLLTPGEAADLLADERAEVVVLEVGIGSFHTTLAVVTRRPEQTLAVVGVAGTIMLAVAAIPSGPLVVVATIAAGVPALGSLLRRRSRLRLQPASIPQPTASATITVGVRAPFRYVLTCTPDTSDDLVERFREHLRVAAGRLEVDPAGVQASRETEGSPVRVWFDSTKLFDAREIEMVEACLDAAELEATWVMGPGPAGSDRSGPDGRAGPV